MADITTDPTPEQGKAGFKSALLEEYLNGNDKHKGVFDQIDSSNSSGTTDGSITWDELEKYKKDHSAGPEGQLIKDIEQRWDDLKTYDHFWNTSRWLTRQSVTDYATKQDTARQEQEGAQLAVDYLINKGNLASWAGSDGTLSKAESEAQRIYASQDLRKDAANEDAQTRLKVANWLESNPTLANNTTISEDLIRTEAATKTKGNPLGDFQAADGKASTPDQEAERAKAAEEATEKTKATKEQGEVDAEFKKLEKLDPKITAKIDQAVKAATDSTESWGALNEDAGRALHNALTAFYAKNFPELGKMMDGTFAGLQMSQNTKEAFQSALADRGPAGDRDGGTWTCRLPPWLGQAEDKGLAGTKSMPAEAEGGAPKVEVKPEEAEARRKAEAAFDRNIGTAYESLTPVQKVDIESAITKYGAGALDVRQREIMRETLVAVAADPKNLDQATREHALSRMIPHADASVSDQTQNAFLGWAKEHGLKVSFQDLSDVREDGLGTISKFMSIASEYTKNGIKIAYYNSTPESPEKGTVKTTGLVEAPGGSGLVSTEDPRAIDRGYGAIQEAPTKHAEALANDARAKSDLEQARVNASQTKALEDQAAQTKNEWEKVDKFISQEIVGRGGFTGDHYNEALLHAARSYPRKPVVLVMTNGYDQASAKYAAEGAARGDAVYVYMDTTKLPEGNLKVYAQQVMRSKAEKVMFNVGTDYYGQLATGPTYYVR